MNILAIEDLEIYVTCNMADVCIIPCPHKNIHKKEKICKVICKHGGRAVCIKANNLRGVYRFSTVGRKHQRACRG